MITSHKTILKQSKENTFKCMGEKTKGLNYTRTRDEHYTDIIISMSMTLGVLYSYTFHSQPEYM